MIFATLSAFSAEGVEQMDRTAAAQAWASVNIPLPQDTPSISGGGLVVESEPNGVGRKVWLTFSASGVYLIQGNICGDEGNSIRFGELYWELNPYTSQANALIYDSAGLISALPYFPQICSVDVIRINMGRIEKLSAWVNPWWMLSTRPTQEWRIGSEGTTPEGQYYVTLGGTIPADATVIIGRSLIATEIRQSPAGAVAVFPQEGMPPVGPTTLTVCSGGKCNSIIFERKVNINYPNGKG